MTNLQTILNLSNFAFLPLLIIWACTLKAIPHFMVHTRFIERRHFNETELESRYYKAGKRDILLGFVLAAITFALGLILA